MIIKETTIIKDTFFVCSGSLGSVGAVTAWLNEIILPRYDIVTYNIFDELSINDARFFNVLVQCVYKEKRQ